MIYDRKALTMSLLVSGRLDPPYTRLNDAGHGGRAQAAAGSPVGAALRVAALAAAENGRAVSP